MMVTMRFWAALRAAAGASEYSAEAGTLEEALDAARSHFSSSAEFNRVLDICAVVVDEVPVGSRNHRNIALSDGAVIDLLPPFAGG